MLIAITTLILLIGGGVLAGLLVWANRQTRQPGRSIPASATHLRVTFADGRARDIALRAERAVTIGRERDNQVVIDDALVSRRHAQISFDGGRWVVQDNHSANGTFLNQARVGRCALTAGDTIQIGSVRLVLAPEQPGATRPAPEAPAAASPPAHTTEQPGYGPFTIVGQLGAGGISRVLLAEDARYDRRLVALKLLNRQGQYLAEKFHQEGTLRLEHPHIARVYETGAIGGHPYIALEYVEGASLRKLLAGRPLPPNAALAVIGQVLAALDYAHRDGIIHRDIKPENILISPHQGVKLIDFGIAKDLATITRTQHMLLGTPHYMSYEQAMGQRVNITSDLYSAAIVLYEMLTAQVPFSAQETFEVIWQHQRAVPLPPRQLNPAIPSRIEGAILRALMKDTARRYQSAAEFATALGCRPAPPLPASFVSFEC